jgi:hypothetical protein
MQNKLVWKSDWNTNLKVLRTSEEKFFLLQMYFFPTEEFLIGSQLLSIRQAFPLSQVNILIAQF